MLKCNFQREVNACFHPRSAGLTEASQEAGFSCPQMSLSGERASHSFYRLPGKTCHMLFPDDTPETCIYSNWSPWSACSSSTCDKGKRMRQRMLKAQLDLSVTCPDTQDFQPCMGPGCSDEGEETTRPARGRQRLRKGGLAWLCQPLIPGQAASLVGAPGP